MVELVFILSILLVFYVYLGYPLSAWIVSAAKPRHVIKAPIEPKVTIVIAAFNEEESIAATLENKLTLDYPREKLEIIVVSDGSTDRTDTIIKQYARDNVRLIRQEPRSGKTSGLNLAIPQASGEIIVFSDANSLYAPETLKRLVESFADPQVGYVTGKMIYAYADGTNIGDGCSAYMKYENKLREIETCLGSVVGVDGGVDAIRKDLYQAMNPDQLPDFVQPLKVVEQGYRVVYEPGAILRESALKEYADEYRMRVRVSLRAFWALYDMKWLLGFAKDPLFAWQLWSHKVLRYLCFIFLLTAYVSNSLLLQEGLGYKIFFLCQNICYFGTLGVHLFWGKETNCRFLTFARYFTLLNLASAHAFGKFLLRKKQVIWTPRKG